MSVLNDFQCIMCDAPPFESFETAPRCSVCNMPTRRVTLKAPGIMSNSTKFRDRAVRDLADTYGFSDVSNRGGDSVAANEMRLRGSAAARQVFHGEGPVEQMRGHKAVLQSMPKGQAVVIPDQRGAARSSIEAPFHGKPIPAIVTRDPKPKD